MKKTTASETAKLAGLNNLVEVSQMTGVSPQTLNNWRNNKHKLFDVVVAGCLALKQKNEK